MAIDRGLVAATAVLPGVMDFWRGSVAAALLRQRQEGAAALTADEEMAALKTVFGRMPPHRMLNLCIALRATRVNNARTRRLILGTILESPKLELWAVKYRTKLRRALEHAWGKRRAVWKAHNESDGPLSEVLKYVFGIQFRPTLPLLSAVASAPADFEQLRILPFEVAKGLWSQHHRSRPFAEVLERTKATMTDKQRRRVQRQAEQSEVVVEWDPHRQSAVDLYIYSFERGPSDDIREALRRKAEQAAAQLGFNYQKIGVVVDNSASMLGGQQQKNRPLAIAYSLRDVLAASASTAIVQATRSEYPFAVPAGETDLATPLLDVLRQGPDAIFVVTDGYENSPSGRFAEVLQRARQMGVETPVFQVSTVAAGETGSVRQLSRTAPVLALSDAKAVSSAVLAETFRRDPKDGAQKLLGLARAELGLGPRPTTPLLQEMQQVAERGEYHGKRVEYNVGPNRYRGTVEEQSGDRLKIQRTHRRTGSRWVASTGRSHVTRRSVSVEVVQ